MKTAIRPNKQLLERTLSDHLKSELPHIAQLQVQCVDREGKLIILVQHPADIIPPSPEIFSTLEQAVKAEVTEFTDQIQIYLRIEGQKRPYSFYTFAVDPTGNLKSIADKGLGIGTKTSTPIPEMPIPETDNIWDEPEPVENSGSFPFEPKEAEIRDEQEPNNLPHTESPPNRPQSSWLPSLPILVVGAGVVGMCFLGSLYALTSPCVMGLCTEISTAQQLSKQSAQTLQRPRSGNQILEAQQQLKEAISTLESIPPWSSRRKDAQQLLKTYQAQAKWLDTAVNALGKAEKASQKSQNPPHSTPEWLGIQQLWREAIAQLEQVPQNSPAYKLAQQKLKAYKNNLAIVNKRLTFEQQAKKQVESSQSAAKVAEARQGVAQSAESWNLVSATWQTAMNGLRRIPQGTTAYREAQDLMTNYQPRLSEVRDRQIQEQFAANAYTQSLRIAQQAQNAGASNQWAQAVGSWRNALSYLKQIPNNTFYYSKSQVLVNSYTDALKQAEARLKELTNIEQASRDLTRTCLGNPQICNYTVTSRAIKVRLTPAYTKTVRERSTSARVKGDYESQVGVVNHVLSLGESLKGISDRARIRLEIYLPDGAMIETHEPGTTS